MRNGCQKGSASLEMVVFMPLIAAFTLVTVQFFQTGCEAMRKLIEAESRISTAISEWMSPAADQNHIWPCLEDLPLGEGGRFEEVTFVTGSICSP